jgi:FkbM family methyltransferase
MYIAGSLTRNLIPRGSIALPESGTTVRLDADVYFVGYPGFLFRCFAPPIFSALEGRVAGVVTDSYVQDYSHMTLWGTRVPLVSMADLRQSAERRPVRLVHFFEQLEQYWGVQALEATGRITVVDFLTMLDRLSLPHTYLAVDAERAWWSAQTAEELSRLEHRFSDARSRKTLAARVSAIVQGDRRPLLEATMLPEHQYFNAHNARWSLIPGEHDVYVDIGAANGDTVAKFIGDCAGKFDAIEAFEPTAAQYADLLASAGGDPRIRLHNVAVGETSAMIPFYDNIGNPFGSNAVTVGDPGVSREVRCVRLDDVVERCTIIKMDVEGFECSVLRGARRLVTECRPDMAITCYHYPHDLRDILDLVCSMHEYRHVALRHFGPSLYDSTLFFSDRQSFE